MMLIRTFAIAFSVAGLVSAVSISPQCQSALAGIVASPDAACINPAGLAGLFIGGNTSIISTVNTWLTGTCALDPCTNSSLAAITTNITTGCGSDLSSLGLTPSSTSQIVPEVQAAYPTFRKVFCLQHTTTNTLCVTETLTNVQSVLGTLSFANVANIITKFSSLSSFPSNVTCTDCIKESYNLFKQELPTSVTSVTGPLQSECGSSFVDGKTPSDITETAKGASLTTSNTSGATLLTAGGVLSVFVFMSSGFVFLA